MRAAFFFREPLLDGRFLLRGSGAAPIGERKEGGGAAPIGNEGRCGRERQNVEAESVVDDDEIDVDFRFCCRGL